MARYIMQGRDSGVIPGPKYVTWAANQPTDPYSGVYVPVGPIVDKVILTDLGGGGGAAYGPSSLRPAAGGTSSLYFCTDLGVVYIDDPTSGAWQLVTFGALGLAGTPAISGTFTALGGVSATARGDSLYVASSVTNSDAQLYKPWPSSLGAPVAAGPWKLTMSTTLGFTPSSLYPGFGVFVSNGITPGVSYNLFVGAYNYNGNAQARGMWFAAMQSQTRGYGALLGANDAFYNNDPNAFFRLICDGTNYIGLHSHNGSSWLVGATTPKSAGPAMLAPTHYGITAGCVNGTGLSYGLVATHELVTIPQVTIVGAVYSAPNVVFTTAGADHGILSGDYVSIAGVVIGSGTSPNTASALATRISAVQFSVPIAGTFVYTSGGVATLLSR